jgi:acetoin utilization protein AcuB
MEEGRLVGIITESDIFKALVIFTGVYQGGIKFGFEVSDKHGSIKKVTDTIRSYGGRIVSILTSYENARSGHRNVYLRAKGITNENVTLLKKHLQHRFKVLYVSETLEKRESQYKKEKAL